MFQLDRQGAVFVLTMDRGENRFDLDVYAALDRHLDTVERTTGARALVTTGMDKFYSNGLNIDVILARGGRKALDEVVTVTTRFCQRLSTFPHPTVAAINGHAYAAGAVVALAHDYRIMREDRGYFCLPEIDLKVALPSGLLEMFRDRMTPQALRDCVLFGRRYTSTEALAAALVDRLVPAADVLAQSMALATSLADKDPPTLAEMKRGLYGRGGAAMP
ncbi:MAG: enoyl-CoA hydratase/isomerase family protein [Alphaproteobacteria bacterium]